MFKLFVVSALLAFGLTSASDVDVFAGDWKIAEFWPKSAAFGPTCDTFKIENLNTVTKCGDKDVSLIKLYFESDNNAVLPAVVVQTYEEVADALKTECEGYDVVFVLRRLNEKYFMQNSGTPDNHITFLWAKDAPTKLELEELVKTLDYLWGKPGSVVCTKEDLLSGGAKRTSGKHSLASHLSIKKQA